MQTFHLPGALPTLITIALFLTMAPSDAQATEPIVHQIALPAGMTWCEDSIINGLFTQVNAYRSQNGVPLLKTDTLGMKDAELRATQFAAYMASHSPATPGFNPHEGYDTTAASVGYNLISENLAYMTSDPNRIVYAVWQDPLHQAAMLASDANVAGFSCVYFNGIPYSTYEPGVAQSSPTPSPAPTPTPTPTPTPVPSTGDAEETAFVTLINNYRAQNGAGPLQVSPTLRQSAEWMSNDMATKNYASHTDSLGRSLGTRLAAFGYTYQPYGENIAGGWADAQTALDQWINACDADTSGTCTYAHRKNMLNPSYKAIGVGRAYSASSNYGWYWTTDFGGVVDSGTTPPPTPAPLISSFSASPSNITGGQSATLVWNVSGATTIMIDNGIGTVSGQTSRIVVPTATTTYRLTASNTSGSVSASTTVTVTTTVTDVQAPTAPVLKAAVAKSQNQVDLAWNASVDNVGVAGYQIMRNGSVLRSVPATTLAYTDSTAGANTAYAYAVQSFDAAGNYSSISNSLAVTTPAAPVPASSCPGPAQNAFTGCYYSNSNLAGTPALVRTDAQINFDWTYTSPAPSISTKYGYSVRWQGNFHFDQATYVFTATISDGFRLYVDGSLVFDRWRNQPAYSYTIRQPFSSGTHLITLEYYQLTGSSTAHLSWQPLASGVPAPVISSFTATPPAIASGQSATLSWSVFGATSVSINNGIGDVSSATSKSISPAQSTTYTLTAANGAGSDTAVATVTVAPSAVSDTQAPTAPVLTSAAAIGPTAVKANWTASTDNTGVTGYQVLRNGSPLTSVAASLLSYTDTGAASNSSYTYAVRAFDAARNYSPASNVKAVMTPVATNSSACAPANDSFTGCYYSNTELAGSPVLIRNDSQINFDWNSASPDKSIPLTNYSVRWQGNMSFDQGFYTFYVTASDGIRLYIDGFLILDQWRDQRIQSYMVWRNISQGSHLMTVEYYERTGSSSVHLSWTKR